MPVEVETIAPGPSMRPWVRAYVIVRDRNGDAVGNAVETGARLGGCITVNLGIPNRLEAGPDAPRHSLIGVAPSRARWIASDDTAFVMASLTTDGMLRLFPNVGAAALGQPAPLPTSLHRDLEHLRERLPDAPSSRELVRRLERTLTVHLWSTSGAATEGLRHALPLLLSNGLGVTKTADRLGITRRQLLRWSRAHLGMAPSELVDIHRLARSVAVTPRDPVAGVEGYADQPHQIRAWRRRLGVTPGAYVKQARSLMWQATGGLDGHFL